MSRICLLLVNAFASVALLPAVHADEIWTYKFIVNGSRPFMCNCDLGAWSADVAGSFSILLDFPAGSGRPATGRLLQLNDHLTNAAEWISTPTGAALQPLNWPELEHGVIGPSGVLPQTSVPFTYFNNVGRIVASNGPYLYDITFGLGAATFNMTIPNYDAYITVTNATAIFDRAMVAGDYYHDVRVDARDYVMLRNRGLSSFDYDLWRANFGKSYVPTLSVPEPTIAQIIAVLIATTFTLCKRRRSNGRAPAI